MTETVNGRFRTLAITTALTDLFAVGAEVRETNADDKIRIVLLIG